MPERSFSGNLLCGGSLVEVEIDVVGWELMKVIKYAFLWGMRLYVFSSCCVGRVGMISLSWRVNRD